jgi:hypothetical protein
MWGIKMRFNVCLAALAATLVASPALAQAVTDTADATARGVVLQTHTLTNQTPLDFGIVTTDGTNTGTVSVAATAAGSRTTGGAGGVSLLPSAFSSARFDGLAAPNETVVLTLQLPTGNVLQDVSATHTVSVNAMYVDLSNNLTRTADANGNFTVYVGGDFGLSATQAPGVYSGLFHLTAEYQ